MLDWSRCRIHKKRAGTHHAELVFLHLVGYAGPVVHSGVSVPRNISALFFMLGWALFGYIKKRIETHYAKLCSCICLDRRVT
jgi:hypothetical protein